MTMEFSALLLSIVSTVLTVGSLIYTARSQKREDDAHRMVSETHEQAKKDREDDATRRSEDAAVEAMAWDLLREAQDHATEFAHYRVAPGEVLVPVVLSTDEERAAGRWLREHRGDVHVAGDQLTYRVDVQIAQMGEKLLTEGWLERRMRTLRRHATKEALRLQTPGTLQQIGVSNRRSRRAFDELKKRGLAKEEGHSSS